MKRVRHLRKATGFDVVFFNLFNFPVKSKRFKTRRGAHAYKARKAHEAKVFGQDIRIFRIS